jgi:tellurite resistance protein
LPGSNLLDLYNICYGNETKRFADHALANPANPLSQSAITRIIHQGQWYDGKPDELRATTSSLGPGVIEIKDISAPTPAPAPAPAEPPPAAPDATANPLEFLEAPEEDLEHSLAVRSLRIIIAAAHADGVLDGKERELIEGEIGKLSAEEAAFIRKEMANPRPIESIVAGVERMGDRKFLFGLAVMTMRADGKVTAEEGRFAGRLAAALKLDKKTAMEIIKVGRK